MELLKISDRISNTHKVLDAHDRELHLLLLPKILHYRSRDRLRNTDTRNLKLIPFAQKPFSVRSK